MVGINNLTDEKVDEIFLKKVARIVLAKEKKAKLDLSIALIGQNEIKELNKKYRKKNKATDVLSFRYDDSFGEVIICPEKTKDIAYVLVHGILHILGYTHKEMRQKENKYLSSAKR